MLNFLNKESNQVFFLSYLLSIYLFLSVISVPFTIKAIFFGVLIISLGFCYGLKKIIIDGFKNYYPYFLFLSICSISYFYAFDENNQIQNEPELIKIVSLFILFIFLLPLQINYTRLMDAQVLLITIFLIISVPIHFFYYESSFFSTIIFKYSAKEASVSSHNTSVIYLIFLLPFIIHKLSKGINIYNIISFIILSFAIFYTLSRTAILLYFIVFALSFFSFNKKFIKTSMLLLFGVLIFFIIFNLSPTKFNELKSQSNSIIINDPNYESKYVNRNEPFMKSARAELMIVAINGFKEKPFFGHGITKFHSSNPTYGEQGELIRYPLSHNDYLLIMYELGLIGIISFLFLFIFNYVKLYQNKHKYSNNIYIIFIQITVFGIGLNAVNLLDHSLFWVIMALTLSTSKDKKVFKVKSKL